MDASRGHEPRWEPGLWSALGIGHFLLRAIMECGGKRSATPLWVSIHAGRQIESAVVADSSAGALQIASAPYGVRWQAKRDTALGGYSHRAADRKRRRR